ncbi:zinc c3hc4 type (ring finger) domain-containing protein [Cystoisospora suis]|uniref:Zinc c3hc4 type (Ring finger) domain-containing protein n=1 Tax=Cystoisospora suis TaxID=483139 RepID=A0A2C6KKD4_9APIC|nr:zinc c3hc4 type (ring finger) domain-containing protein [Cystoisospora suis]
MRADATEFVPSSLRAEGRLLPSSSSPSLPTPPPPLPCSTSPRPGSSLSSSPSTREPGLRSSPHTSPYSSPTPSSYLSESLPSARENIAYYKKSARPRNPRSFRTSPPRAGQGHASIFDSPPEGSPPRGTVVPSTAGPSIAGRGRGRGREQHRPSSKEKLLSPQHFFTYKPYVPSTGRGWSGERGENKNALTKGTSKSMGGFRSSNKFYSKERFVLANCRVFVQNEKSVFDAGYNPDCSIDWAEVVKVETWSSAEDPINCPFCLEQPEGMVAPTVGKCGHIFCLPCVLKYFEVLAPKPSASSVASQPQAKKNLRYWQRCPLCFEPITKKDLRPARVHQVVPPRRGSVLSFSLLSRPLSSTVVQLAKPFITQAAACAACSGLSSSSSCCTAATSTSAARESLLSPNYSGDNGEKKEAEEECKSYRHLYDSNATDVKESVSSLMPGEKEKQSDLSFFGAKQDYINHPSSSTLFSRSFLPLQCPACAIERRAKLLRRQKNVQEASCSNPVASHHDCKGTTGEILCSSSSGHPDPSATGHTSPSDSVAVTSHSFPSSSFEFFLSLGARLTQRLCPQCVESAINFSSRKSCQTGHSGELCSPSGLREDRAVGEDDQHGRVAEKKDESVRKKDDRWVGSGRETEEPKVGEGEESKEEESGGEGERKTKEKGGEGGRGSRRALAYHSPRVPQSSSSCGCTGVRGEGQEDAEENKRDGRSSLSCDLTLGSHFGRISVTHAPASPWQSHALQLASERRQIEANAERSPDYESTLHALAIAEEFVQVKEAEMFSGHCYACSSPLTSSTSFSSSSSSSQRPSVTSSSRGETPGGSSPGDQQRKAEQQREEKREDMVSNFNQKNDTKPEDNLQDFIQVLHAVQKMQRENKPLRSQAKRKQVKRGQQQGAPSSLSSSPGLTFSLPPANTRSTSPSLASTSHACEEDEKGEAGESRRREEDGASTSTARIPQGRHEKNKGGGGGGSSLNLSEFYFYQASDGQLCFVHPFFIKCLLHEVEGEENDLPAIIPDVRVVDVQPICVDEVMRRRFKCLGHLPQMSQATLVDIDLRGWLSPSTVKVFKGDFYRRKMARIERQQQEEREAAALLNHSGSLASSSPGPYNQRPFRFSLSTTAADPLHPPTDTGLSNFPSLPGREGDDHREDGRSLEADPTSSSSPLYSEDRSTISVLRGNDSCEGNQYTSSRSSGKEVEHDDEGESRLYSGQRRSVDGGSESSSFVMIVRRKEEMKFLRDQRKREEHFPSLAAASALTAKRGGDHEPRTSAPSVWRRNGNEGGLDAGQRLVGGGRGVRGGWGDGTMVRSELSSGTNRAEKKASQPSSLLKWDKQPPKGKGGKEEDTSFEDNYLPPRAGGCNLGDILLMQKQKTQKKKGAKPKASNHTVNRNDE